MADIEYLNRYVNGHNFEITLCFSTIDLLRHGIVIKENNKETKEFEDKSRLSIQEKIDTYCKEFVPTSEYYDLKKKEIRDMNI